jgi:hypothetical protein
VASRGAGRARSRVIPTVPREPVHRAGRETLSGEPDCVRHRGLSWPMRGTFAPLNRATTDIRWSRERSQESHGRKGSQFSGPRAGLARTRCQLRISRSGRGGGREASPERPGGRRTAGSHPAADRPVAVHQPTGVGAPPSPPRPVGSPAERGVLTRPGIVRRLDPRRAKRARSVCQSHAPVVGSAGQRAAPQRPNL